LNVPIDHRRCPPKYTRREKYYVETVKESIDAEYFSRLLLKPKNHPTKCPLRSDKRCRQKTAVSSLLLIIPCK
jgi:hypothetical protein